MQITTYQFVCVWHYHLQIAMFLKHHLLVSCISNTVVILKKKKLLWTLEATSKQMVQKHIVSTILLEKYGTYMITLESWCFSFKFVVRILVLYITETELTFILLVDTAVLGL